MAVNLNQENRTAGVYPRVRKSCAACGKPLTGRQRTCCGNTCWQQHHRDKQKAASVTTVARAIHSERDRIARLADEIKVKQAAKTFNPELLEPLPRTDHIPKYMGRLNAAFADNGGVNGPLATERFAIAPRQVREWDTKRATPAEDVERDYIRQKQESRNLKKIKKLSEELNARKLKKLSEAANAHKAQIERDERIARKQRAEREEGRKEDSTRVLLLCCLFRWHQSEQKV